MPGCLSPCRSSAACLPVKVSLLGGLYAASDRLCDGRISAPLVPGGPKRVNCLDRPQLAKLTTLGRNQTSRSCKLTDPLGRDSEAPSDLAGGKKFAVHVTILSGRFYCS